MNLKRFYALFIARNMEFFRDKAALSWNLLMPVLLIIGFTFAFSNNEQSLFKVGVLNGSDNHQTKSSEAFFNLQHVSFISLDDAQQSIKKIERHQLDLLLDQNKREYWINDNSANGYMVEQLLLSDSSTENDWQKKAVDGTELRYIDWVIPGVLGMNMMFSALYGVGYVIVRYRKNGVLKRLQATPLSAVEFLVAQLVSRLWILIAMGAVVYAGLNLFLDFRMFGNYFTLLLVFTLGAITLIALGLIITSRLATEEVADGFINLISFPMMFLSGIWFSLEGAPQWMQQIANIFPLTHVTTAARAVMLDGSGLAEIWPQLLTLGLMSVVFLTIGSLLFRWQN